MGWLKLPVPEWVDDKQRMLEICREIEDVGEAGIDTETTGKDDLMKDHILFWSLSTGIDNRYCMSRRMLPIFKKEISQNPHVTWWMSNVNFDNCMLANSGVPLMAGNLYCTLVMDNLHDENDRHGLKPTALRYLGLNMNEFKSVFKKRKNETYQDTLLRMMKEEPDKAVDYASMDAWASMQVGHELRELLQREETYNGLTMWDLYERFEAPYHRVLYENIRNGLLVDVAHLEKISVPINEKLESIEYKCNKVVGKDINLQSPKQLVEFFIDGMGEEPVKWTSGGQSGNKQPSVDEAVLEIWSKGKVKTKNPKTKELATLILEHRSLAKVKGTYIDGMIRRLSADGRIHSQINQHITVTGRLSSSDPNLQNIPRPDKDEWGLRGSFIARPGYTIVAADYAQLEMRILAHMSGDENMRNVIRKGWDIHMGTASIMYDVPYELIQEAKFLAGWLEEEKVPRSEWPDWVKDYMDHRQDAKQMGFGINYGKGDGAIAQDLGCTKKEAKEKKEKYFKPYPKVREFVDYTHASCRENLVVYMLLGRKRRLVDADADWRDEYYDYKRREFVPERPGPVAARALRQDVNSIIQGTAGEIVKLAQLRCHDDDVLLDYGAEQLLQIHDEILFEIPNETLKPACARIQSLMERPLADVPDMLGLDFDKLSIPLDVDVGTGRSWAEAH